MNSPRAALAGAALLLLSGLDASAGDRLRLYANAAFQPSKTSFSSGQSFTEYLETGGAQASYAYEPALLVDAGIELRLVKALGVNLGVTSGRPRGSASYTASFPHPLYLGRPRAAGGTQGGLGQTQSALHLDLALLAGGAGRVGFALFGGVSLFRVATDVLGRPLYSQQYPYDSVSVTDLQIASAESRRVGFNAGGRVDYRLGRSRRLAIGAQLRFARARVRLEPAGASSASLDVGGVAAGGGLRLYF